ncbi:MAG: peptidylprolyl isomerase [Christensenellaceae bacterium]|jgi:peptidyl-prolyl cis-trans isomerase C|nr:peptidylprolyl isomerase [Christensenellaceae bacterium]
MKNNSIALRVAALALVAALVFTGCSAVINNPVVAKVGDVELTYSQFANMFSMYSSYGLIDTSTAEGLAAGRTQIMDALVESALPIAEAHKQGLTLTEEETAAALAEAQSTLDSYLASYLDSSIEDEAARNAAAIKAFNAAYKSQGVKYAEVKTEVETNYLDQALGDKLADQVTAVTAEATEAEAKTWYDAQIETERAKYKEDATAYYSDSQYYSYYGAVKPLVAPEGMFYVKHILIQLEEPEDSNVISSDSASFGTAPADEPARDPKALAQEVLDKVNADGADFDALIAEYGEDPGMEAEPNKTTGYVIGEGYGTIYDTAFYEASMLLKEEGATSGLVESSFGYHIIRRVGDVSTEPVPFDEVKADILTNLNATKQSEAYAAALEQWRQGMSITKYDKRVQYVGVN